MNKRHPTEREISECIREIFKIKLMSGEITTKQYYSFKGMCKSKKKSSERCIRNWFMKNDPKGWTFIEKFMNVCINPNVDLNEFFEVVEL